MCTNSRDCIEALFRAHDIHLLLVEIGDRVHRIQVWITGAKGGRRLKQHIGRKVPIGDDHRAQPGDAEGTHRHLVKKIATASADCLSSKRLRSRGFMGFAHILGSIPATGVSSGFRSKTSNPSMVIVWAGHRSAQRPQRMHRVSSLTMTEPSPAERSIASKCWSVPLRKPDSESKRSPVSPENPT